jgi:hypothetical protein
MVLWATHSLTFHIPFLFRIGPGIDLIVQGSVNRPTIAMLSGIIETDWGTLYLHHEVEIHPSRHRGAPR